MRQVFELAGFLPLFAVEATRDAAASRAGRAFRDRSARVRVEPPDRAGRSSASSTRTEVVVGRAATAGLVVPDSSVSRQHARLFQRDGRWWAEDLGATNGTLLNDKPLTTPTALTPGDRLKVGASIVQFVPSATTAVRSHRRGGAADGRTPGRGRCRPGGRIARRRGCATLNEIHRALATAISLPELLDLILAALLRRAAPGRRRHPAQAAGRRVQARGEPPAAGRQPGNVFVSRRIVDEVAGKQRPALVLDAAMDERFADSHSIVASGVRSVVAAPLVDADGTIGLIALSSRVSVRQFAEQDLDLLVSLASAAALRVRNVALAEEAAARKVLERELALAHDMQMAMLPRQMPDRAGDPDGRALTPARSVGGDLYDFVLDDDGLWFIVADVVRQGRRRGALHGGRQDAVSRDRPDPAPISPRCWRVMNRELSRDNEQMMFVTAIVGRLSFETGEVIAVDAGHNPAFVIGPRGEVTLARLEKSMALGVMPDAAFAVSTFRLDAGSTLLLYTDGATDARNTAGELLAPSGCRRPLVRASAAPPRISCTAHSRP